MRVLKISILYYFLLLSVVLYAKDNERVVDVEIKGLLTISVDEVKSKLETQQGKLFSSESLKNDIQRLYELGYFGNIEVQVTQKLSGLKVTFLVTENQLLGKIEILGNEHFNDQELLEDLRISEDKYLAPYALSLDVMAIEDMYREDGFFFVNVTTQKKRNQGWVDLYFLIDEGTRVSVSEINFFGNGSYDGDDLLQLTEIDESGIFTSSYYDENKFREDLILIRNFYRSEGFLDVRVHLRDVFFSNNRSEITLNISIDEGERYYVNEVVFNGNKLFSRKELHDRLRAIKGAAFRQDDLAKDKRRIEILYGENGFLNVKVDTKYTYPDLNQSIANVVYNIEEGDVAYIRKIDIKGNVLTRDDVVRRELLVTPGQLFNLGRVEVSKSRLARLHYFDSLKLNFIDTEDENWKDLQFNVEEGRTGSLRFAAGITSDLGAVGEISLTKRNFAIGKYPTSIADIISGDSFTGAGQSLNLHLQVGENMFRFSVAVTEPYLYGHNISLGVAAYRRERTRESWIEGRTGGRISLGRRIDRDSKFFPLTTSLSVSYGLELIDIDNVSYFAPRDVWAVEGDSVLSTLGLGFVIDTRDDPILPTRGYTIDIGQELAGLGGDYEYLKTNIRLARFQTIYTLDSGFKHVLSLGMRFGLAGEIGSSDSVPIFERFFAGGSTSIRGFEFRTVGPKENGDPIGGEFLALGTLEYNLPIYQNVFRMVMFTDIGNVLPSIRNDIFDTMRLSVGFGFRIRVPMLGPRPLALDFGFPIFKEDDDDEQMFSFSFGKPF